MNSFEPLGTGTAGTVRVHFLDEDVEVEAPRGSSLQAIADKGRLDLPFGCRTGTCGCCRIRIHEGLDRISAPDGAERAFLAALHAPPEDRLACAVRVDGDLALRRAEAPGHLASPTLAPGRGARGPRDIREAP